MHAYRPAQGPHRTRILYVFRSPAGSRIGREPLDGEVQEALEHTHPDLTFDWQALLREFAEPLPRGRPDRTERTTGAGRTPAFTKAGAPSGRSGSRPGTAAGAGGRRRRSRRFWDRRWVPQHAARLRARYGEILQRIARRSRSPEERDRLVERARRLNPDDWPGEAEVRSAVAHRRGRMAGNCGRPPGASPGPPGRTPARPGPWPGRPGHAGDGAWLRPLA